MGAVCSCVAKRCIVCFFSPSLGALEMLVQQKIIGPALCGIEGWSYSVEDESVHHNCIFVCARRLVRC